MKMGKKDFKNLIVDGCKDNANIYKNPEMLVKYTYDTIAKQYALESMPNECREAHKSGLIHWHDLEFFNTRPNCFNADIRFIVKNGLKIDGMGVNGSVANPAKSLEVLLNQCLQFWMAGATVFSGGQGFINFNTLLAPFARGRTYSDIKQAIQGFIYNANMSLVCRGGQILFSNIGIDLSIPDVLKNKPAYAPAGVIQGVYGDYQEEADLIFRAIIEVSCEKDAVGKYHRFPNLMFNIREGDLDEFKGNCRLLHEYGANNPTWYYVNCLEKEHSQMGCRSNLEANFTGDYELDCANTGNFAYTSINLPLIALECDGDIDKFWSKLNEICEIVYTGLIFRREEIKKVLYDYHLSDFLLQKDIETGEPLYDLDRTTITLGFVGLYECLQVLNNQFMGQHIIKFLNDKKDEFAKRDGLRWSVIASPAESTAHRFANIIKEKYPDAPVQGDSGFYYLTNGTHIPVSDNASLVDHIKNADKYHPMTLGGNILHLWLGEVWSDAKALWKFNKRILETGTQYWAYSKVFTWCKTCGYTINDNLDECPICKSKDLVVMDRITGYYQSVSGYNNGKKQEFNDRYRHKNI